MTKSYKVCCGARVTAHHKDNFWSNVLIPEDIFFDASELLNTEDKNYIFRRIDIDYYVNCRDVKLVM